MNGLRAQGDVAIYSLRTATPCWLRVRGEAATSRSAVPALARARPVDADRDARRGRTADRRSATCHGRPSSLLRGVIAAGDTDGHIPLGNALWDLERHEEAEASTAPRPRSARRPRT